MGEEERETLVDKIENMIVAGKITDEIIIFGERWIKIDPNRAANSALDAVERIRKWEEFPHDLRHALIERATQYFLANV